MKQIQYLRLRKETEHDGNEVYYLDLRFPQGLCDLSVEIGEAHYKALKESDKVKE